MKQGDYVCLRCGEVNGHSAECPGDEEDVFQVLSSYSRAEAIADGVLVDCSQPPFDDLNRQIGIAVHVAMTAEAFHSCVFPISGVPPVTPVLKDQTWVLPGARVLDLPPGQTMLGRYWDVIWMLRLAMQRKLDESEIPFQVAVVPSEGGHPESVQLKCIAGPDDTGHLCLTIMLINQD